MKSRRLTTTILAATLLLTGCSGDRAAECREQGAVFADGQRPKQERLDAGARLQELDCYNPDGTDNF